MSSFARGLTEALVGIGMIALDILAPYLGIPLTAAMSSFLLSAGAGMVLSGIGTMLQQGPLTGLSTSSRNPIAPWLVVYGRSRVGGTIVFIEETGESDKYLHLVLVVACHPIQSIDALLMDGKRACLDMAGNSLSFVDSTAVIAHQQNIEIAQIQRSNNFVTVEMVSPMPLPASSAQGPALMDGDQVIIRNVPGDQTLNGTYNISVVDDTHFTYSCAGMDTTITMAGWVTTTWPDYGDTIHMEVALGNQGGGSPPSPPFPGLLASDDTGSMGLWTNDHLLLGHSAVYLRLKYGGDTYASGLPTLAFLVHGKKDILDPRQSPMSTGYTENAALCIADYLSNKTFGFKAVYGTEIPYDPLIAAANTCDENVPLINGYSEPRYALNGQFVLSMKRGEVLQNLLTSCGGRLTYTGGQFVIHPAGWPGVGFSVGGNKTITHATLSVITSHIVNTEGRTVEAQATTYNAWGSSTPISTQDLFVDSTAWTSRINTLSLDPPGFHIALADLVDDLVVSFRLHDTLSGASSGEFTPFEQLLVYDASIAVTYADGSTATLRPTSWRVTESSGWTNTDWSIVLNPANALDANASTAATVEMQSSASGVGFNQYSYTLQVEQWVPSGPPSPPDLSQDGMALSAQALGMAVGPFQWKSKVAVRDLYNGVKGTFISPVNNWQSSDLPRYAQDPAHGYPSDANLAADGGDRRWLDVQLPFTISPDCGQRLCKIELMRRRQQGVGTFAFNLAMYQLSALDVIAFTLPLLGWNGKLLEISAHRFTVNKQQGGSGEVTLLGTELDLQETDPSVYEWNPAEALTTLGYSQVAVLPNMNTVGAPTGLTLTSGSSVAAVGSDGQTTSRIQIQWTPPADGYVTNGGQVEVQYQEATSPAGAWVELGIFDSSVSTAYINGVTDGTDYNVRVRSINVNGATSDWTTSLAPVTASGSSLPAIDFQTNGVANAIQNKLNLISGANVTLTADGAGGVTIASTGGGGTTVHWTSETPSGTLNGSNTAFTLSNAPNAGSLALYLNGVEQSASDYTLAGAAITFTVPPKAADWLLAIYTH